MAQTSLEERMAKLEGAYEQIDQRLGRVEAELIALREEMQRQINAVRQEIEAVRAEVRAVYRMMISILIPMWVTIIGAIIGIALTR